jgi:hypothetical protein
LAEQKERRLMRQSSKATTAKVEEGRHGVWVVWCDGMHEGWWEQLEGNHGATKQDAM